MGKRTRRDRRKAQQQRAVATGDPSSLRAVTERSPDTAAATLAKALLALQGGELPEALGTLVVSTSERLRASGKFVQALELAAAAKRASYAVRLEEALAAFGCGHDGIVRELAAADPLLARPLAPLLAVLNRTSVPNSPAGSGALTRGVHSLCRATLACETGKAASAFATLQAVPATSANELHIPSWKAAALLNDRVGRFAHVTQTLLNDPLVRATPAVEQAVALALAAADPSCFLNRTAANLGFSKEALAKGSVVALRTHGDLRGEQAQVVSMVMAAGADAFAPEHRGAAALYEGFAFATSDPPRALAAFDKAVAHGADLGEALRGRVLAGHLAYSRSGGSDRSALKATVSATQRLIHLVGQRRDGAPFRALLLADLAELFRVTQQSAYALDAVRQCRALLADGIAAPSLTAKLALTEVLALRPTPQLALEAVERWIQELPRNKELRILQAEMLERVGRKSESDDAILASAELFDDPDLHAAARTIRRERGLPTLEPGKADAGQIAAELAWRVEQAADSDRPVDALALVRAPDLIAARAVLEPEARAAYDAAALGIIATHLHTRDVVSVAASLLGDPAPTRLHRKTMLAVVLTRLDRDELEAFAQGLVKAGMSGEVLVDAGKQVAFIWGSRVAKGFLARMAAHLKASEVREIQAESKAANPVGDDVADLLRDAGKLLEPAFDLDSCAAFDDDDDDDDGDCDDPFGAWGEMPELSRRDLIEGAREMLRQSGVSEERIRRVPPASLQRIGSAVKALTSGRTTDAKLRTLVNALELAGFWPEDLPGVFFAQPGGAPGRRRR